MADRKSRDVGPSRESSRSSHQDLNRRTREEADKRSSKEKGSDSEKDDIVDKDRTPNQSSDGSHHLPESHYQLKKLQHSLSRFRKHLEIKNKKPLNWQPPDLQIHELAQKSYSAYLEKFDLVQQSLPKILLDPLRAQNIIKGIEQLANVNLEREGISQMYTVINSMHNAMQRLSSNGPEGSGSKGSDTTG
jgi:hypothetical protein